jgi:hypothetical protein
MLSQLLEMECLLLESRGSGIGLIRAYDDQRSEFYLTMADRTCLGRIINDKIRTISKGNSGAAAEPHIFSR